MKAKLIPIAVLSAILLSACDLRHAGSAQVIAVPDAPAPSVQHASLWPAPAPGSRENEAVELNME